MGTDWFVTTRRRAKVVVPPFQSRPWRDRRVDAEVAADLHARVASPATGPEARTISGAEVRHAVGTSAGPPCSHRPAGRGASAGAEPRSPATPRQLRGCSRNRSRAENVASRLACSRHRIVGSIRAGHRLISASWQVSGAQCGRRKTFLRCVSLVLHPPLSAMLLAMASSSAQSGDRRSIGAQDARLSEIANAPPQAADVRTLACVETAFRPDQEGEPAPGRQGRGERG